MYLSCVCFSVSLVLLACTCAPSSVSHSSYSSPHVCLFKYRLVNPSLSQSVPAQRKHQDYETQRRLNDMKHTKTTTHCRAQQTTDRLRKSPSIPLHISLFLAICLSLSLSPSLFLSRCVGASRDTHRRLNHIKHTRTAMPLYRAQQATDRLRKSACLSRSEKPSRRIRVVSSTPVYCNCCITRASL